MMAGALASPEANNMQVFSTRSPLKNDLIHSRGCLLSGILVDKRTLLCSWYLSPIRCCISRILFSFTATR